MSLTRLLAPKTLLPRSTLTSRFLTTEPHEFPDTPTCTYYDELINNAGRARDYETILQTINKRGKDGFFNTSRTFNFITKTDSSLSILNELIPTLSRLDRGFTRKHAFDSLISRLCKLDFVNEAMRVVNVMTSDNGVCVNAVSFHPILVALTKKKGIDEAWRVIDMMRELGVPPDRTVYNCVLTSHCVGGDLEEAAKVLTVMVEEGVGVDSRTFDALVIGACRAGRIDGAFKLLRRMEDEGVSVLYSTHAHVYRELVGLGYYSLAVKFVMAYGGRDLHLDTENFGNLASRLIRKGRFEEAKFLLEEMDKRGLSMGQKLRDYFEFKFKNVDGEG